MKLYRIFDDEPVGVGHTVHTNTYGTGDIVYIREPKNGGAGMITATFNGVPYTFRAEDLMLEWRE